MSLYGSTNPERCNDVADLLKNATPVQREKVRAALGRRSDELNGFYRAQLEADEAKGFFEKGDYSNPQLAKQLTSEALAEIF